ncbi:hypothetical protein AB5N19_05438 [Seiridium cardinale]|uniref:Yeast cell wall synthesis Kre9/Knh1-like N-terminal domain-containing protein n=1 Tax=Seiridium cardinale TaxID=138064 RepID=A0ABR2XJ70_9PEZI
MRFTISAALLAFAATAFAQTDGFDAMTAPLKDEEVSAGTTYSIKWQPTDAYDDSTVTLSLLGGDSPSTLLDLGAFAEGVDNSAGSYEWAVASSLGSAVTYGIKITLDSNAAIFQYSFPFHITSSGSAEISSSSSSSAAGYPTSGSYSSSAAATYPVITASSAPVSTAVVISTTSTSSSYSTFATVTASGSAGNSSATYSAGASASTTLSTANHTVSSSATSTPTVVTTNGAPRAAAGSLALIGLVAAVFAL